MCAIGEQIKNRNQKTYTQEKPENLIAVKPHTRCEKNNWS